MKRPENTGVSKHFKLKPRLTHPERRLRKRVDIRENDGITADVLHNHRVVRVRLWDVTTLGVCILTRENLGLKPKDIIWLRLNLIGGQTAVSEYEVRWVQPAGEGQRMGLQIFTDPDREITPENMPNMLWVSNAFPVSGYIYNDVHYLERSIFRLIALSSTQIVLDVFDQEHLFFHQQEVKMQFQLQTRSNVILTGKIARILNILKNSVRILVEIDGDKMTRSLERDIVGHLTHDQGINMDKIRAAGFKVRSIASSFRFRFVKTQEEYEEVLKLRFAAYSAAGKLPEDAGLDKVVAPLDKISRILIAFHGEKIVASVAMAFPDSEDVVLDTERPLPNGYEGKAPPKTQMIEIARLCTAHDYRGGDLLLRMFEHIYRVFVNSDRKYLISSTDNKLWPIYKKLGFKKMGLTYAHPFLAGMPHDLILIDLPVLMTGRKIGLLRWRYFYAKMTEHVQERHDLEMSGFAKLRFKLYLALSHMLDKLERFKKK